MALTTSTTKRTVNRLEGTTSLQKRFRLIMAKGLPWMVQLAKVTNTAYTEFWAYRGTVERNGISNKKGGNITAVSPMVTYATTSVMA
jgi:hypothetical protein